jgi:hypothetical protein
MNPVRMPHNRKTRDYVFTDYGQVTSQQAVPFDKRTDGWFAAEEPPFAFFNRLA